MKRFEPAKENLIEIRKNIFVSKDDPDLLKKYIHYNPTDANKLFDYAKELEAKGDTVQAYEYFSKAANYGHYESRKILEKTKKPVFVVPIVPDEKKTSTKRNSFFPFLWLAALLCLLFFSFLLYYLFSSLFNFNKTNETTVYENHVTNVNSSAKVPTKAEELAFVAVHSAIEYYQDKNGVYPISLDKLAGEAPGNYLSMIPSGISYERTTGGFQLSMNGMDGTAQTVEGLLTLIFYEKTNQLGVKKGEELLALYPVASGERDHLPDQTIVTKRVVNPNGGAGPLGTRGLQLTDDFAIHGTNDPTSIGLRVTLGCIRMKNEDIETLYPYIAIGTPFVVEKEQTPGTPSLPGGIPPLKGASDFEKETTPGITYHWKY